ncbi:MAG: pyridoxamine 5'-phosphate oxidase [Lentimicrobiaceae bacterium]|nr:pyridoxamine 5'-phosphate oxidase [Lentimicrobiaceae bacterium]MCB9024298.1 pyridoxamine 5'-phosphate oxidase [Lentimicrobiaceae bacterium]MCO5264737.1 pyridoxamine 5'-phosphate oxidase [Lentimicrobium sp.]HPG33039.1 pyridoxamine 5'-phosphate oxidase [Lentimicrobium sp.]
MNISDIRQDYKKHNLALDDTGDDPFLFFEKWLHEALSSKVQEPTAMALSTVSDEGKPSSRIVLLKGLEEKRFIFFSNYESTKGLHLKAKPFASLLFFWPEMERQVRIEGSVVRISNEASDIYFNSRPLESRVGAMVSPQSKVISGRAELEEKFFNKLSGFRNEAPKRPENWGGYALSAQSVEFWQGRSNRLHDRVRFRLAGQSWIKEILAP